MGWSGPPVGATDGEVDAEPVTTSSADGRYWTLPPLVLAAALALPGCTHGVGNSNALEIASESGTLCVPADDDGLVTVALDSLTNTSAAPVQIVEVSLNEPQNLEVADWVIAEEGTVSVAATGGWRPPQSNLGRNAVPSDGEVRLVLGLRLQTAEQDLGTAPSATVTYVEQDGSRGKVDTRYAMSVTSRDACP